MIGSPPSPSSLSPCISAPSACPQDMPPARQRTVCALATVRLQTHLLRLAVKWLLPTMPTNRGGIPTWTKMDTSSLRSPLTSCALLIVTRAAPDRGIRLVTLAPTLTLLARPRVAIRHRAGSYPSRSLVPANLSSCVPLAAPTLLLILTRTTLAPTPNLLTRPRVAFRLQCGNCPWRSLVPASLYLVAPLAALTLLLTLTSQTILDLTSVAGNPPICRLRQLLAVPRTARLLLQTLTDQFVARLTALPSSSLILHSCLKMSCSLCLTCAT